MPQPRLDPWRIYVNRLLVLALAAFASLALIHADFADAARMGGGRSFGMQRSITPPAARTAPSAGNFTGPAPNPVMPARPGATAAAPAATAAAAGTASRSSRWLGPIAGIAAGLGLAALFSHLGLSEGLGSLLLIGLLLVGAVALFRAFASRRAAAAVQPYGGAGVAIPPARFETATAREPVIAPAWGSPGTTASPGSGRYPPGFDAAPFLDQSKQQFRRLQAAYDRGDRDVLADVTTPDMLAEITRDLAARTSSQPTEVLALDAEILEVVREGDRYVASVRFHGSLREDGAHDAHPFEEVWNLVKPVDGSSGWLLAGIQQYA
jgi:predicted lipid-binding transport protein (Tim44 family)